MFAKYLKLIEKDNGYEKLLDILKDNPSIDEIYNVYFYLYKCLPYLHKEFYIQNSELIKTVCINYINNLDEKNMRKLPKELNELVSNLIYQINLLINKNKDKEKNDDEELLKIITESDINLSKQISIYLIEEEKKKIENEKNETNFETPTIKTKNSGDELKFSTQKSGLITEYQFSKYQKAFGNNSVNKKHKRSLSFDSLEEDKK